MAVTAADLDADGDLDLAVSDGECRTSAVRTLLNRGDGSFPAPVQHRLDFGAPGDLKAVDVNRDGDLDIAVLDANRVFLLENLGEGGFGAPLEVPVSAGLRAFATADFDGDGDDDFVCGGEGLLQVENLSSPFSRDANGDGIPDDCQDGSATPFQRGDASGDSRLDLSDAVVVLGHLFGGTGAIRCDKAADANDDGRVDVSDPVVLLRHLFAGGGPLPPPFAGCGRDPTPDALGCEEFPRCR